EDNKVRLVLDGTGHFPPLQLISELRFYRRILGFTEGLAKDTETRSIGELAKYVLVSYVNRATGTFRDRNASGLLAEVVGPASYTEDAHRMWRNRNYLRLEKHFSKLTEFIFAMGVVIA